MTLMELYARTPVKRHHEIVVDGNRVYFDNEEYLIAADGELRLIHSHKWLRRDMEKIKKKLGIT